MKRPIVRFMGRFLAHSIALAATVVTMSTQSVGQTNVDGLLNVSLESTSGRHHRLREYLGAPVVIVHETRDASGQNRDLVADLRRPGAIAADARVFPVADVSGYHWWPAEGFARSAVRDRAAHDGVEILLDWSGELRAALGFRRDASNVAVLGRDGRVVFQFSGTLSPAQRAQVLAALH